MRQVALPWGLSTSGVVALAFADAPMDSAVITEDEERRILEASRSPGATSETSE